MPPKPKPIKAEPNIPTTAEVTFFHNEFESESESDFVGKGDAF